MSAAIANHLNATYSHHLCDILTPGMDAVAFISHMKSWPSLPWCETRAWERICFGLEGHIAVSTHPDLPWRWDLMGAAAWLTPQFVLDHSHQPWSWNCWSMLDMVLQLPLDLIREYVTDKGILALVDEYHTSCNEKAFMVPWPQMQHQFVWFAQSHFAFKNPDTVANVMRRWCRMPTVDLAFVRDACLSDVGHLVKWDMQALMETKAWKLPTVMALKIHLPASKDRLHRFVNRWLLHTWCARVAQRRQQRRCDQLRQDLMAAAWHPRRLMAWCLDEKDKRELSDTFPEWGLMP